MIALVHGAQMSVGFIFWLLMLLWLVLGFYWYWPRTGTVGNYPMIGGSGLLFVLLFLLGWSVFGFPVG